MSGYTVCVVEWVKMVKNVYHNIPKAQSDIVREQTQLFFIIQKLAQFQDSIFLIEIWYKRVNNFVATNRLINHTKCIQYIYVIVKKPSINNKSYHEHAAYFSQTHTNWRCTGVWAELQGLTLTVQIPFTSLKALQSKSATTVFSPAL